MNSNEKSHHIAYSAPIVSKAMRVLRMIITSSHNPGISEIASGLSLAKSTTHGILAALEEAGWVLRDPITRKYTCGHSVRDLSHKASVRVPLVDQARPYLEKLASEVETDVFLGMFTGHDLLVLDQIESVSELRVTARPGTRLNMFAGGAGKIFLAFLDREEVTAILRSNPLPAFTEHSITDPQAYLADLEKVRQTGVALDAGEYIQNVWAVAAPIFYGKKNRRRMVAGFWLVGLDWYRKPGKMEATAQLAAKTSQELSRHISNS